MIQGPGPQPGPAEPAPQDPGNAALAPLRERIDQIDRQLVELLSERAKIVVEIGNVKRDGDHPIYAPDREQRVLAQVRAYNPGPLPDACLEAIWRELMSGSFALERSLRIGYLGPPGSFSHLAARKKFGASVEYDNLDAIPGVFDAVARGHIDLGLIPIENSTEGSVTDSLDSFLDSGCRVYAEVLIAIQHNLLANITADAVQRVYSHPQALAQCKRWLSVNLPGAERVAVASTSKAAEVAASEEAAAAIGSTLAGELYGLKVQFAHIEDNPQNTTRFFVIARQSAKPSGDDKTSVMFTTENKAGALTSVLDVFRDHGLNLTHIDKRPSKRVNWEYCFFIDVDGHESDPALSAAIDEARKHCLQLTVLGSFPRAREVL